MSSTVCLVLSLVGSICLPQSVPRETRPQFSDYTVAELYAGKNAAPKITDEWRSFRRRIREGASHTPNFSGSYRIVEWGCDSDCVRFALIDLKTGVIYGPPFDSLWLDAFATHGWRGKGLEYRNNSRLLVVDGCPTEKCATYFYEWTGSKFRLVQSEKHLKNQPVYPGTKIPTSVNRLHKPIWNWMCLINALPGT